MVSKNLSHINSQDPAGDALQIFVTYQKKRWCFANAMIMVMPNTMYPHTSENAKMEKHWTRRGLNLNLCTSRALETAETSIITGSLEAQRFWFAELDAPPCEVGVEDSLFGTSWLVTPPTFFKTSNIVGCLSFPLSSELEAFNVLLSLLLVFGELLSCIFLYLYFSMCPIWLSWLGSGDPKWST